MTHLLELLSQRGPETLLLTFTIPISFATLEAASELYVLYKKETKGPTKTFNMVMGWIAAFWFGWVAWDLLNKVWLPGQWKSAADFLSTTAYIACVVPLIGMAFVDLPWVKMRKRPERRLLVHAGFTAMFTLLLFVAVTSSMWNG